nr:MAG TPA: hypothetical protein [Caudoviricetes sp.]
MPRIASFSILFYFFIISYVQILKIRDTFWAKCTIFTVVFVQPSPISFPQKNVNCYCKTNYRGKS